MRNLGEVQVQGIPALGRWNRKVFPGFRQTGSPATKLALVDYIQQLDRDQAGTLAATEGESVLTVRRRLTATAEVLGRPW